MTFTASDSNGGMVTEVVRIAVAAKASPAIIVLPESLDFGPLSVGRAVPSIWSLQMRVLRP